MRKFLRTLGHSARECVERGVGRSPAGASRVPPRRLMKFGLPAPAPLRVLLVAAFAIIDSVGVMASSAAAPFLVEVALAGHGVPSGAKFVLKVHPDWAPLGAARFKELVESKVATDTSR